MRISFFSKSVWYNIYLGNGTGGRFPEWIGNVPAKEIPPILPILCKLGYPKIAEDGLVLLTGSTYNIYKLVKKICERFFLTKNLLHND